MWAEGNLASRSRAPRYKGKRESLSAFTLRGKYRPVLKVTPSTHQGPGGSGGEGEGFR